MNKQRKVLITITYNEMGIIIDTKAEEVAQPEIIRCKDCKHYKFADNCAFGFPVKRCECTGFEDMDDDDFCSRAEKRMVNDT